MSGNRTITSRGRVGTMRFGIRFFAALILSCSAFAAEDGPSLLAAGDPAMLATTGGVFSIRVVDEVSGGCLPRPKALEDAAEVVMRRNGFGVSKEQRFLQPELVISALGFDVQGGTSCLVFIAADLQKPTLMHVPFSGVTEQNRTIATYTVRVFGRLLSGPKHGMQADLEEAAESAANSVFLTISRARDTFFAEFPAIENNMETSRKGNRK